MNLYHKQIFLMVCISLNFVLSIQASRRISLPEFYDSIINLSEFSDPTSRRIILPEFSDPKIEKDILDYRRSFKEKYNFTEEEYKKLERYLFATNKQHLDNSFIEDFAYLVKIESTAVRKNNKRCNDFLHDSVRSLVNKCYEFNDILYSLDRSPEESKLLDELKKDRRAIINELEVKTGVKYLE